MREPTGEDASAAGTNSASLDEHDQEILDFWRRALPALERGRVPVVVGHVPSQTLPPPAWSFGATPAMADELLELVLEGRKSATASALWDYAAQEESVPQVGDLSIILDGGGRPRALIVTTRVRVIPFEDVDAEHAAAEGEGDRSLAHWREVHERFFTEHADHDRGFSTDMPVVCEDFEVVFRE